MDRFKNIITNILGLIFWGFSVYEMTHEAKLIHIGTYLIIGAVLFRYKWADTKLLIDRITNKKLDK
jgi:uncharacterized membrane protein YqgA involved in biofilm formation